MISNDNSRSFSEMRELNLQLEMQTKKTMGIDEILREKSTLEGSR